MSITIEESGMNFGPYSQESCFQIEKSPLFTSLGKGLKIAEFVLLRHFDNKPPEAWVIEAKSSAPKEHASYVDEIRQKFTNSIQLTLTSCLQRHKNAADLLPQGFLSLDLANCPIKCILVIKNFPKAWLDPLQKTLIRDMNSVVKTMGLRAGAIIVINDVMARERHLII